MKRLTIITLAALMGVALAHGMFSFYWLTFDPSLWTADARFYAISLYSVSAAAATLAAREATE
jgi:flagellar basal body-associated protein FliL